MPGSGNAHSATVEANGPPRMKESSGSADFSAWDGRGTPDRSATSPPISRDLRPRMAGTANAPSKGSMVGGTCKMPRLPNGDQALNAFMVWSALRAPALFRAPQLTGGA